MEKDESGACPAIRSGGGDIGLRSLSFFFSPILASRSRR
jgi:hypothetical protein